MVAREEQNKIEKKLTKCQQARRFNETQMSNRDKILS